MVKLNTGSYKNSPIVVMQVM